jgi:hypothetical protein
MATTGMTFTGDWDKVKSLLGSRNIAESKIKQAKTVAMKRTLAYFQRQIVLNIKSSGVLAGAPFKPLSPVTLAKRKDPTGRPLVDTGDMWKNVIPVVNNENNGFVGLKRGERHVSGGELVDIGQIHEEGAILESGVEIPKRAFIKPVLDAFAGEAMDKYVDGVKQVIK